jgi:hypothetical protein
MTPEGYFQQLALNGQCFFGSTTNAGVAIPAYNATAQVFGLWNPAGSGVNLVLNKLSVGIVDEGTNIVAAIGLSFLTNTGSAIAGSGQISAFTDATIRNAIVGGGVASKARFTLTATTAATSFLMSTGMSWPEADMAGAVMPVMLDFDFNGSVIVPQGVYVGLGGSAAPGSTCQATISWAEVSVS